MHWIRLALYTCALFVESRRLMHSCPLSFDSLNLDATDRVHWHRLIIPPSPPLRSSVKIRSIIERRRATNRTNHLKRTSFDKSLSAVVGCPDGGDGRLASRC